MTLEEQPALDADSLLEADDLRVLVEIGFMALAADHRAAGTIFAGAVAARPAQEAGHIGQALVCVRRNDTAAALKILRPLPPTDAVRLLIALALALQGERSEARAILSDLAETAAGTPPGEDARRMIEAL